METAAMIGIGMREIEGRGRGLVSLQPLKAGQVILSESPILLYSALHDDHDDMENNSSSSCSHCFRTLQRHQQQQIPPTSCSNCRSFFCSPDCISLASATSHTPWACQSLTRLRQYHSSSNHHLQLQARFLVSAYNLSFVSPPSFQTLLSLQGRADTDTDTDDAAVSVHSLISSLCPPPPGRLGFSLEMTALLLAKEKINSFCLMEPYSEMRVKRSVRAYGIYPLASLFNHDCLPNACWFDYVDSSRRNNTDIIVRMIHDVPQGKEICLSYFRVNLNYSERQKRLKDDYGFICNCDRCKVEANWWSDLEQEDERQQFTDDDFPHAYFFRTYVCRRRNCWGTLAPLPPSVSGASSTILECNFCGNFKNMDQV